MKTDINSINVFIEYEDTLEEMFQVCKKVIECDHEDIHMPDSRFWRKFPELIKIANYSSIDFTDINVVYDFMKAFVDYIPTNTSIRLFIEFYNDNKSFILESPERTVRYFNCVVFDEIFINHIIEVRPFLSLPINKVNLKDRKFYKLFWNSLIMTQNMRPEFYHRYPHVFLSDIDLAACLKCSYIFYKLNSTFRNMIYHKWFKEKD
ncbi:MAG: hypothetical protein J6J11_03455 [Treponema sp.]|nr:hypothetical protein [Clostridia bacterium]MBP3607354.1 hypothetical protein [Treponema sp.]